MSLTTREGKGSKLTIQEMDGNLTYLQANGFVDGQYTRIEPSLGIIEGEIDDTITYDPKPFSNASTGTYTVTPTTLTGEGAGAEFELVVEEREPNTFRFSIDSFVIDGGFGYAVGDTLTVPYSEIGGVSVFPSDVVTFTLQEGSISGPVETYVNVSDGNLSVDTVSTSALTVKGEVITSALTAQTEVFFPGLPTEDPVNLGQLWNDSGSLKISAGE
jgi:hypothetical protein